MALVSPMDDLSAWLLERVAERERLADRMDKSRMHGVESNDEEAWHEAADSNWLRADCESKRRIISDVIPEVNGMDDRIESEWGHGLGGPHEESALLLRLLALPYADRPGYREAWRPQA